MRVKNPHTGVDMIELFLTLFIPLMLLPSSGFAVDPELPRVFLDTTYLTPTGKTIQVKDGGDFQTALNTAQLGDVIML
jgi:hypothetical protein